MKRNSSGDDFAKTLRLQLSVWVPGFQSYHRYAICHYQLGVLPRELTYSVLGKGKSSSEGPLKGDMFVTRRVDCSKFYPGWWFWIFFMFIPTWGNDPIWGAYFSKGLKPPTSIERCLIQSYSILRQSEYAAGSIESRLPTVGKVFLGVCWLQCRFKTCWFDCVTENVCRHDAIHIWCI